MNRRNFLSLFGAGVAGIAIEQAIPLGRVWSFPKEILIASSVEFGWVTKETLDILKRNLFVAQIFKEWHPYWESDRHHLGGAVFKVRYPQQFLYSGAPPTLPPVIQLKSRRAFPDVGIPES